MDLRVERLAKLLVEYSARIGVGDRVLLQAEPPAAPLVRALFESILENCGHPVLLMTLDGLDEQSGIDDLFMLKANADQLGFINPLLQLAYDQFESRIRIQSVSNAKLVASADPAKLALRRRAVKPILDTQLRRGDAGEFRWVSTLFPTVAYAQMADMNLHEYEDFVFEACHVSDPDSDLIAFWQKVNEEQQRIVDYFQGHDQVLIRGPNCDLTLSIKDRNFINANGLRNMPDGEIFTGPVEESVEGWIHFDVPPIYRGIEVEGVRVKFERGKVVDAKASKNQDFLEQILDTDVGARYVGELGIGTNYDIQRYTKRILLDEKIGGTFHIALGSGYPMTGSKNSSAIHWDMICYVNEESEIVLDGEVIYKNGTFLI
jgi:aminopeptidase